MTKTDIAIYRGLKEKFDPEVHVGFFITTDTGELLLGDQSLGQTISGWEINDGVLILKLNTGRDIRVTFPEATETAKGLLSAANKAQLNALQANLDSKVDKVTGKSLLADSEIEKLAGLPNSTELTNSIATAKAAGDNAQSDLNAHKQNKSNPHEVTKAQVGLGNVTNDAQVKRSEMGVANGVATLDADGKVPASQLPSYVDDIIDVYATYSKSDTGVLSNVTLYLDAAHTQLVTGEAGKIYQNIADGEPQYQFRWTGTIFSQTGASSLVLGEVTGTAYDGAKGKANADNIAKIKGTSLSHIKDAAPVTTAADKVSINYECYEGNQYGAAGTDHTADIPAATTTKAGVMSAADKTKLENLNSKLVVADEEDVTAVDGKIKLKDRGTTNGMGYKILRLPENGILTQDMINQANTIYEIRYNFDLNGATITIPENCTLKFEGGKLSNGSFIFNRTILCGTPRITLNDTNTITGTISEGVNVDWFTGISNLGNLLSQLCHLKCTVALSPNKEYTLSNTIKMGSNSTLKGSTGSSINFTGSNSSAIKVGLDCTIKDLGILTSSTQTAIEINTEYLKETKLDRLGLFGSYPSSFNIKLQNLVISNNVSTDNMAEDNSCAIKYVCNETGMNGWGISSEDIKIYGRWHYAFYIITLGTSNDSKQLTGCSWSNCIIALPISGFYFGTNEYGSAPGGMTISQCQMQSATYSKYFIEGQAITSLQVTDSIAWDWVSNGLGTKAVYLTDKCRRISLNSSSLDYEYHSSNPSAITPNFVSYIGYETAGISGVPQETSNIPDVIDGNQSLTFRQIFNIRPGIYECNSSTSKKLGLDTYGTLSIQRGFFGDTVLTFYRGYNLELENYHKEGFIASLPLHYYSTQQGLDKQVTLEDWIYSSNEWKIIR